VATPTNRATLRRAANGDTPATSDPATPNNASEQANSTRRTPEPCPGRDCTAEFTRNLAPFSRHRPPSRRVPKQQKTPAEQGFHKWAIQDSNL
jgi:hypothetical protein